MGVTYSLTGEPGANELNQYERVETGGSRFILSEAPNAVTVNGVTSTPAGGLGFRWTRIDDDNSTHPLWSNDVVASSGSTSVSGHTWTPLATVVPTYDSDGNLTYDGRWDYVWDAENRLIRMTTAAIAYASGVGVPNQ